MIHQDELGAFLRPWMRKARLLILRDAVFWGLSIGGITFAIGTLLQKGRHVPAGWMPAVIGTACMLLVTGIVFLQDAPTKKKLARQLDETGLDERAATMVSLWDEPTEIAELQRTDALSQIQSVETSRLRRRSPKFLVALFATSLLLLAGSVSAPESWFPIEQAAAVTPLEQAMDILRKEEQQLLENEENVLAQQLDDLIQELETAESDVEAAAAVESAMQAAQEAAEAGEATPEAAAGTREALEEAMNTLTGGAPSESEPAEAAEESSESQEAAEAEESEASSEEGEESEEAGEAEAQEPKSGEEAGTGTEPGTGSGSGYPMTGQSASRGGNAIPSNMTEPVYDPISGSVMYGEVFSAYYAEYLLRSGEDAVPGDLRDALDTYYADLNQ